MLIPSFGMLRDNRLPSLSRRVNANSQQLPRLAEAADKLIKKGEC